MGLAPSPDLNHRVTLEIAGPVDPTKFEQFRAQLKQLLTNFGATVLEEVKTKKKYTGKKD